MKKKCQRPSGLLRLWHFFKEDTWRIDCPEAETIQLTNRIILSPFAAKQLAAALERVMRDYESTFGTLKKTAPRSTEVDRKEKSAALFRLVKELDIEIGLEHSFKSLEKTMLKNRFLL